MSKRQTVFRVCLVSLCCSVILMAESVSPSKSTVAIPMRDGTTLATDLFMPSGFCAEKYPQGVPAILVCTPYAKDREQNIGRWRDSFLQNGYAFAVQDMRGFHASAAAGKGSPRRYDGYDTVEWLASQSWSNGKVGMLGHSHFGAAQYETGRTAPPHLACAIPAQAPANYYTDAYYPTVFRKADMETILRGPFTARTQQLINRRIRSREIDSIPKFNIPMLHSAGWYDFYTEGAIEMFQVCQRHAAAGARGNQKLIIGPWGHGVVQEENLGKPLHLEGGVSYPPNSKLDWEKDIWLPWFGYWLKGEKNGIMARPSVLYYLMGAADDPAAPGNVWMESEEFPPKSTAVSYFSHLDHSLSTQAPSGELKFLQYRYDPRDPVPTVGRFHARLPVKGPYDQRPVETRHDVLLFTTAEMQRPLHIVGRIQVRLWASSDCRDTDFTAKLTDVYPDGRSMIFADSIVRARYRSTYLQEEFLTPGEIYEFEIDLGYTAIVLAPGHRLRLAISSSNFDRFEINPNTGEPYGDHAVSRKLRADRLRGTEPGHGEPEYENVQIATNKVYMDRIHQTQVVLPIVK